MDRVTRKRRIPRRRSSITLGLPAVLVLTTIAGAAYAATPQVVLDDPGARENTPSASDGYLVWSADSEARPGRFHSYVLADGGSPVRIDPAGGQLGVVVAPLVGSAYVRLASEQSIDVCRAR